MSHDREAQVIALTPSSSSPVALGDLAGRPDVEAVVVPAGGIALFAFRAREALVGRHAVLAVFLDREDAAVVQRHFARAGSKLRSAAGILLDLIEGRTP